MRVRNLIYIGLICGTLILTGCGEKTVNSEEVKNGTAVEVISVLSGEIAEESRVNGRVVSENEVAIYSPINGEVKSVNVKVGDEVTTNTVLFTVDNESLMRGYKALVDDYERTKALLDKQIELAEKSVQDTKTIYNEQVRQAEVNAKNINALYEVGAATTLELDNVNFALQQTKISAETAIKQAELSLTSTKNSAESTLTSLENGIKDSWEVIDKTNAKSTINGTVTSVNVKKGAFASPQVASVVVSNGKKQQVLVSVSETLKPNINVGDEVLVVISAISNEPLKATVDSISPTPSAMTSLYDVYINIDEEIATSLGMFAEVTFRTNRKDNAISVPTQAILTNGEAKYVYITEDEVTAKKILVETGIVGVTNTEITSGLNEGDKLIVKGQSYLSDASSIRIVEGE